MIEEKKATFFYGYVVVIAAFFIMLMMMGLQFSFGVFFKPLATEFGWTRAMTSGAYSMFMALHGALFIVAGRLTDRFGPRVVVTACGFLTGLGYLLMSQISTIWQLYLFYGVIISMGMGGGYVPLLSMVARWFTKRRGLMTGITIAGTGTGLAVVPAVSSWLISIYGWRLSYVMVGGAVMVLVILAAQLLRNAPGHIERLPRDAKRKNLNLQASGLSLSEALMTRRFWIFITIYLCSNFFQQAIMVHIVPYATDAGISALVAANILSFIGGLSIAGRIIMGSAGDRIGNKLSIIICFILTSASLLWLLIAKELWMLYLFAIVFGFGYGGIVALQATMVAELFGLRAHGIILGVVAFGQTLGGAASPVIAGYIFDVSASYQLAFIISAIFSITGIMLGISLRPPKSDKETKGLARSS